MKFSTLAQLLLADQDQEIEDANVLDLAYGIENFEFSPYNRPPFDYPSPEMRARLQSLRARLAALKAAKASMRRTKTVKTMTTCDCGHSVTADAVMNTSSGTSCLSCYDRMSR